MKTNVFATNGGKYLIESYGNGWAYEVTCQRTGESFFVQDDAAAQLRQDTNDFDDTSVLDNYMEALGEQA